jgi:hypothetical protein
MEIVSISSLSPTSAIPSNHGFKALVTLLWPFSSANGQCALLLADPDARQRYQKGQVRVRFTGPSAHQIAISGIGIGDSVQVALVGVQWLTESDTALVKTPGKSVDGELMFKNRLHMIITRGESELKTIDIDESNLPTLPKPTMLPPSTPVARSESRTSFDAYGVAVYSSPAFMKRLRLSEGGTPYTPVPVSEDDDQETVASRKRRRVSYKNVSEWKFDAREPSPEKEQDHVLEDADGDENAVTETAAPETATIETGNVTQSNHDLETQDVDEPTENADRQVEQPDSEIQSIEANSVQPAQETIAQDLPVEAAREEPPEIEDSPRPAGEPLHIQEPEGSSAPSQITVTTSLDEQPSTLPRLTVLPTESELIEQMARAKNIGRPTTPILQPLLTKGLPLPSPFPTSAQKIPSPIFSSAVGVLETTQKETLTEDTPKAATYTSNINETAQNSSPVPRSQEQHLPENGMVESHEPVPSPETVQENADPSQQESDQQEEAPLQKPRVVADTYDGYAEEHPVLLSSGSEDEDDDDQDEVEDDAGPSSQLSPIVTKLPFEAQSRGDEADVQSSADEESDEDMESSSEDSESDAASSVYDSDQIVALQEESGDEGAIEEPDWDYLERKLEQEEAALQQSREDLIARDPGLDETADDFQGDDAEDVVMHDDNSELDGDMMARSDDDSADDDSDSSGYFDRAVMPGSDGDSSGDSEVEAVDPSYQPSMPENAMYSQPFGLDGAYTQTETRTALPSQAASETASVVGDETIAWRDRDAAVEALVQQARPQVVESSAQAPTPQHAIPSSSSRLDVVELLDDSESEGEDDSTPAPVVPETVDFSSSVSLVKSLLNNKQKDAHLEFSGPVTAQIRSEMRKISEQVDSQSTRWIKFNALKTILKIGTNVAVAADSGNMFAEGVKYRLKEDEVLVNVCWKIYNQLSNEEKHHKSQPPDMLDCLDELEEKRDYCFEGFTDFLKQFKHNRHHLPVETKPQQPDRQSVSIAPKVEDEELQRQSAVKDKVVNHTPVPQVVEEGMESVSINRVSSAEQLVDPTTDDSTEKATEPSERTEVESEEHVVPEVDVEAATLPRAELVQDIPASVEDVSPSHPQSLGDDDESESEVDGDEIGAMSIGADSLGSADERDVDPALPEEDYEIDPALLEDTDDDKSSHFEGYEIDPALLQEEHEIDPALLAEGHDNMPSNDLPSSPQADETMSEAPEPDASSVVDDEESNQQSLGEEVTSVVDETMMDEVLPTQIHEEAVNQAQEASLVSEVQPSVEMDPEILAQSEADSMEIEAPPASISEPDNAHEEETRPLSSSSFRTLSPTPGAAVAQEPEPVAQYAAEDFSNLASQVPEQPIEELDLSQAEPSWTSRLSQFSQSRSSRAHTRSETIPDSADEDATDLEAENIDDSSRPASQVPETQAPLSHGVPELSRENMVQPSQELGTALSQFQKQAHGPSGMQLQLDVITDTPSLGEEKEMESQVGIDDDLLADYAPVVPESEAILTPSNLPPAPSTPLSTKKPARPLTLFRGRKSVGSRLSFGGVEQQTLVSEQQAVQDEVMQDVSPQEPVVSTEIAEVTGDMLESDKQVQDKIDPTPISESSPAPEILSQTAQEPPQATEITSAIAAPEPEASIAVEQPQASEVEQASSEFQLEPTLKPFAEVEASLFGTPIKGKKVAPQEPQSAPSQTWRNTLSSKMSEVPVIGSWFTPRRTTEIQKAVTEHKATTSSTSFVEETPTKAAAVSSRDRQKSISPPPLQRYASQGTSTSLSYFTPLAGLHQHLNQQSSLIDIVAICTTATTTAERAKSGPKDYYTTFRIVDQPLHEYNTASQNTTTEGGSVKDVSVEIFRPFRQSLPKASPGDVVLLRGFVVRSRNHKSYLLSTAASGWCVWRYGEPSASLDYGGQEEEDDRPIWARKGTSQKVGEDGVREEVTGPPVEIGDEEREKVAMVKSWWETLEKEKKAEEKEEHDIIMID